MSKTNEREWYAEHRGMRLTAWIVMNAVVFAVYLKTDSLLWAFVLSAVLTLIRKAPLLWELDRIDREIKQEQKTLPHTHTRAPAQ